MAVSQHPEFHAVVPVIGQLLLMLLLKPFFALLWVFLVCFCFPHHLHGVIILRGICSSFQFCFSLRKSNVLEISPVGQLVIYPLQARVLQELRRRSALQTPDLGTIAGNEGLSPGRLCVSYSMS